MGIVFHVPVLAEEVVKNIFDSSDGTYLDGTIGGGGHAEQMLSKMSLQGLYVGIDRDYEALEFARERLKRYKNIVYYLQQIVRFAGNDVDHVILLVIQLGI